MLHISRILAFAVVSLAIFSCKDDEKTPPDTTAPAVTISSPVENSTVKGKITISGKATDKDTETLLQIFFDATNVKEATGSEINAEFDTRSVSDGTHTIKIVATDKAGNTDTKSVGIKIQNIDIKLVDRAEHSKVSGVTTIKVSAGDVVGVTMKISVDQTVVKETTDSEVSVELDTKTMEDGDHEITIAVTDQAGNTTTEVIRIEVRNILLSVNVPLHHVEEGSEIYYVLSKNDGSMLGYKKLENGTRFIFPTPDGFNPDSTFVLTEYFYLNVPGVVSNVLNVYGGLEAGEYDLGEVAGLGTTVGRHQLHITDVPAQHYAEINGAHTSNLIGYFGDSGVINQDLAMDNATSDLFFMLGETRESPPKFKYFPTIQPGRSTSFSVTDLVPMIAGSIALSGVANSYSVTVTGFPPDYQRGVEIFYMNGASTLPEIPLYFPGTIFPEYRFDLYAYMEGVQYYNTIRSSGPPSSLTKLAAEVTSVNYANGRLHIKTTGDHDMATIQGGSFNSTEDLWLIEAYSVNFASGITGITLPTLPEEILHFTNPFAGAPTFSYASVEDYTSLSTREDYQRNIVFSSDKELRQYKPRLGKYFPLAPNSGGRISLSNFKLTPALQRLRQRIPGLAL
jgi:hypothetical protein